jgi:hypothetical protein
VNVTEHLLTCLAEEAAEVAQDCCKALRFGLNDRNVENPTGPTNRERLVVELNQLVAVADMLTTNGDIPEDWFKQSIQAEKRVKVRKFMTYAEEVGSLQKPSKKGSK